MNGITTSNKEETNSIFTYLEYVVLLDAILLMNFLLLFRFYYEIVNLRIYFPIPELYHIK